MFNLYLLVGKFFVVNYIRLKYKVLDSLMVMSTKPIIGKVIAKYLSRFHLNHLMKRFLSGGFSDKIEQNRFNNLLNMNLRDINLNKYAQKQLANTYYPKVINLKEDKKQNKFKDVFYNSVIRFVGFFIYKYHIIKTKYFSKLDRCYKQILLFTYRDFYDNLNANNLDQFKLNFKIHKMSSKERLKIRAEDQRARLVNFYNNLKNKKSDKQFDDEFVDCRLDDNDIGNYIAEKARIKAKEDKETGILYFDKELSDNKAELVRNYLKTDKDPEFNFIKYGTVK
jgi:hypothetical protein